MLVIARQIKAARSLLGWEQHDLAARSGVAISTIRRLEGFKDAPLGAHVETLTKISRAFEAAGIEFLNGPGPGVKLSAEPSVNKLAE
ncbi:MULTISPECIES: transcriptional regulator [Bradyrhizobium]|uniref:Transcriptional regulator n=2 Tax=Bradyrhizobium TaxID=374 RepID=A0A939M726_9BRAD|nr:MULTISPECIES: transcriptional regulator [Bradyrhizobium]MBP2435379.1 transcriptional regulator with XRE-family HTH domain [Bradyrhizobium elkanii]MCP1737454.1 transcriptional regulator with XRE-family HTH domain [Bradyrhizobium elkanii]MCS3576011.1 transcriptional regulator with XRE-family HTH domain [Bradyrhizobium elkanii]MCS3594652.1 transcriptional regulator with XRE-family HTH domain [Bradyrhizobium elkanii]MCS3625846.1 transcriptional regulator with XRE-family HTH domain [Bradyrhizobi